MTAEGPPSPPSDPPTRVVVAVLTYRRLPALTALLPKLVAECRSLDAAYGTASHVLVVDNDQQRAAQPVVAAAGEEVRYVHEPTPGIAAGRARAVEEAAQDDLLVFIDDDEIPGGRWLTHLWEAWNAYSRPAGVVGRVTPTFCGSVDPWIEAGAFFRRKQRRSGTLLAAGSSANLLLDLHVLRDLGLNFGRELGLAGGEDTLLTRRLTAAGHRLVWCSEAEVVDVIPEARMRRRWVLQRAFSHGAVESRVSLTLGHHRRLLRVRLCSSGAVRIAAGLIEAAAGYLTRRLVWQASGLRLACRGAGMLVGGTGREVVEYRRPS